MQDRLLLIDDEQHVLSALRRLLRHAMPDVAVEIFTDPAAGLRRAQDVPFSLALVDYRMPGTDGTKVLQDLRALQPDCTRVILSGYADLQGLVSAINQARIARFLAKPWIEQELVGAVAELLQERRRQLETAGLADAMRLQRGQLTPQELERRQLERLEPGITHVEWGPHGEVLMDLRELEMP